MLRTPLFFFRGHLIPLLVIGIVFSVLFLPSLSGHFSRQDEEIRILTLLEDAPQLHPQLREITHHFDSFRGLIKKVDAPLGRFRPALWLVVRFEARLFRDKAILWQINGLLYGVVTCFLLYFTAIRLRSPPAVAVLLVLWTILGSDGRIWGQFFTAERIALLPTVLALLFATIAASRDRSTVWDLLTLAFLALAGLIKESFILIIPSVILFRILLEWIWASPSEPRNGRRRLLPVVIGGLSIFLVQVSVAYFFYSRGGYSQLVVGPVELSRFDPRPLALLLLESAEALAYFLPSLGLIALLPDLGSKTRRRQCILLLVILALWIGPQLILYRHRTITSHYAYPLVLGLASINALGLATLWARRKWFAVLLLVVLSLGMMAAQVPEFTRTRSYHSAESILLGRVIDDLVEDQNEHARLLVVTDYHPSMRIYTLISLSWNRVYRPVRFYLADGTVYRRDQGKGVDFDWLFKLKGVVSRRKLPRSVEEVVVLVPFSEFRRLAGKRFDESKWDRTNYSRPYFELGWWGFREVGTIEFAILRAR